MVALRYIRQGLENMRKGTMAEPEWGLEVGSKGGVSLITRLGSIQGSRTKTGMGSKCNGGMRTEGGDRIDFRGETVWLIIIHGSGMPMMCTV